MYFVYVLYNKIKDSYYIGYTGDLERRLSEHRRKFPKDVIICYEAYQAIDTAKNRERMLKYYGSAWRALKKRIRA